MQEAFSIKLKEEQETNLLPLETLAYAINTEVVEVNRRAEIIGAYLIQAKQQLPNDTSFMEWVSQNCPFSHSTALGLMNYAKGVQETPCLMGKPKSIVLEVMKLPSGEREAFIEENDGKSVRQIRKLIEERDAAKAQAAKAAQERDRFRDGYESLNEGFYAMKAERDKLAENVKSLMDAEPKTVEVAVEVAPPDYVQLKEEAESARVARAAADAAQAKAQELMRRAEEAERYAEEQEELRKQAQSELRRIKDGSDDTQQQGTPYSAVMFSEAVQEFIGHVGPAPHMSAFFRAMSNDELDTIDKWLDVIQEWLAGTKTAIHEGLRYIDVDSAVL